jgi:hypothetical protein
VNDSLIVHKVNSFKNLLYQLARIALCVAALGHYAIEELATGYSAKTQKKNL